jgi:hypothetical protein
MERGRSARTTHVARVTSLPHEPSQERDAVCYVCAGSTACGCDENNDPTYINDVIGNGSYAGLNKTLVTISDVNGTKTLALNGTLEKDSTAPGGNDYKSTAMNFRIGRYTGFDVICVMFLAGHVENFLCYDTVAQMNCYTLYTKFSLKLKSRTSRGDGLDCIHADNQCPRVCRSEQMPESAELEGS